MNRRFKRLLFPKKSTLSKKEQKEALLKFEKEFEKTEDLAIKIAFRKDRKEVTMEDIYEAMEVK